MVSKLEEPYPSKCFNNGKLVAQTQLYYECKKKALTTKAEESNEEFFRVSQDTYKML